MASLVTLNHDTHVGTSNCHRHHVYAFQPSLSTIHTGRIYGYHSLNVSLRDRYSYSVHTANMAPHPLVNQLAPSLSLPDSNGNMYTFTPGASGVPCALLFYPQSGARRILTLPTLDNEVMLRVIRLYATSMPISRCSGRYNCVDSTYFTTILYSLPQRRIFSSN